MWNDSGLSSKSKRVVLGGRCRRISLVGATLVEILTVVAIIMVIAGIVFSVVVLTKDRAKQVVDMSNLHQLGLAGAMYAADYDDVYPLSVTQLLLAGYGSKSIISSPTDSTEEGMAIEFRREIGLTLAINPDEYPKISYIGYGDGTTPFDAYGFVLYDMQMTGSLNQGWLVDITRAEIENISNEPLPEGIYRRLLFDTSVVTRNMGKRLIKEDGSAPVTSIKFTWYFGDFNDETKTP